MRNQASVKLNRIQSHPGIFPGWLFVWLIPQLHITYFCSFCNQKFVAFTATFDYNIHTNHTQGGSYGYSESKSSEQEISLLSIK